MSRTDNRGSDSYQLIVRDKKLFANLIIGKKMTTTQDTQSIVYLTMYSGDLLPKWYIGSTTLKRVNDGYNGSVDSKEYKSIWQQERKNNPQLFTTRILSYHDNKQDSLDEELRLHKKHKVIKNPKYINMSYCQRNGFHGGDTSQFIDYSNQQRIDKISKAVSGSKNGSYGKKYTEEEKSKSEFFKRNLKGEANPNYGRKASDKTKEKQSIASKGNKNSNYGNCWCVLDTAKDKSVRKLHPKDNIPMGWISCAEFDDRKKLKQGNYGKSWYNDGTKNYLRLPQDSTHLIKGRIKTIFVVQNKLYVEI